MTIAFDAIYIPIGVTVLAMLWAYLMLSTPIGYEGVTGHLFVGVALPLIPTLLAWLVWALVALAA